MAQWKRLLAGGAAVYAGTVATFYVYQRSRKDGASAGPAPPPRLLTEDERRVVFDTNACHYDADLDGTERMAGLVDMRKQMCAMIPPGSLVLDVGAGTGRNLPYMPFKTKTVLIDFAERMLQQAASKAAAVGFNVVPASALVASTVPVRCLGSDGSPLPSALSADSSATAASVAGAGKAPSPAFAAAAAAGAAAVAAGTSASPAAGTAPAAPSVPASAAAKPAPAAAAAQRSTTLVVHNCSSGLPFPDASFDVVTDTFGLCSYEAPAAMLREMRRVLKPGGRILLLEHGQAEWRWLAQLLDKNTAAHVAKHGCYWARPIEEIVTEAGLTVHTLERKHAGTTYWIVAS